MMLKKISCLLISLFAVDYLYAQQDAQYSLYVFNQIAINPAYAGTRDVLSSSLIYRNQWASMPQGAPSTAAFSIQTPLHNKKIGVGAEMFSDKIGPKISNGILLSYAYRLRLGKGQLALGLKMGMINYIFDWTKIDYKDKDDNYNTQNRSSKFTGSADFGWYYYTRSFYWGMSFTHINHGKITEIGNDFTQQAVHFFMPIGKSFQVGNVIINPTYILKKATNSPATSDFGVNVLLKEKWWIGISFRRQYGTVFLTQYQIKEKLKIGYSYDYGTNKMGRIGGVSHEIMISYIINNPGSKTASPRYL